MRACTGGRKKERGGLGDEGIRIAWPHDGGGSFCCGDFVIGEDLVQLRGEAVEALQRSRVLVIEDVVEGF